MSIFYKIDYKIDKYCSYINESAVNGWKGWIILIAVVSSFIFLPIYFLNQNPAKLSDMVDFGIFFGIFCAIILLRKNFPQIRKIFDFIQHSCTTFIFNCVFVSILVFASYNLTITLGLINLYSETKQASIYFEAIVIMVLASIVLFSFNPTSLIMGWYMEIYDKKWKTYRHFYLYYLTLALITIFSILVIWSEHSGVDFPHLAKLQINAITQAKIILFAFILHFLSLLISAYDVERKYLKNEASSLNK